MSAASFEDLVETSITQTLSKILGSLAWQSIAFYFDPKALSKDPGTLPELLDRIFGKNHGVLEKVIAEDLLSRVGVPAENRKGSDFKTFIRIAKARFIASATTLATASSA